MPDLKRLRILMIPKEEVIAGYNISLEISLALRYSLINQHPTNIIHYLDGRKDIALSYSVWIKILAQIQEYSERFGHSWKEAAQELWKSKDIYVENYSRTLEVISKNKEWLIPDLIKKLIASYTEPKNIISGYWEYNGITYGINSQYNDEQTILLILEDCDKERQRFEKLKLKFGTSTSDPTGADRQRVPEKIRIEVWRRDGGKCARCGSRLNLE